MAAFYEAPSFSLGLDFDFDFDFDSEPQIPVPDCATQKPSSDCSVGTWVAGCIGEIGDDPPRKFKQLELGPAGCSSEAKKNESSPSISVVDDDIEEFSWQQDSPRVTADCHPSPLFQSVCSSSKGPPLPGILLAPTSSKLKAKKDKQTIDAPTSVGLAMQNKSMFPNLTTSSLRKFQLLESDLDDPSCCDNQSEKGLETASSLNKQKSTFGHSATINDCCSNELMDELNCPARYYFFHDDPRIQKLVRNRLPNFCMDNHTNNSSCSAELIDKLICTAHYYFFHDDLRIQKLVRNRLPDFCPLGVDGSRVSMIDYMRQFSGEASIRRPSQVDMEKSSKRSKNISKGFKSTASKRQDNEKAVLALTSKKASKRQQLKKTEVVAVQEM